MVWIGEDWLGLVFRKNWRFKSPSADYLNRTSCNTTGLHALDVFGLLTCNVLAQGIGLSRRLACSCGDDSFLQGLLAQDVLKGEVNAVGRRVATLRVCVA